jgi:hypothetical protein
MGSFDWNTYPGALDGVILPSEEGGALPDSGLIDQSVFDGPDKRYQRVLAQRGGRLAHGFYKIRRNLGDALGISLISTTEKAREDTISYHQSRHEPGPGIVWDDPEEEETNRLLR